MYRCGKLFIFMNHCTKNHIFVFQMIWKDGLSKKIALEYDLSSWKDYISFPRKYDLTLWTENERWISLKIHGNMIFSSNVLKRWSFQKKSHWNIVFLVSSGKMVFLSLKNMIFFLRQKMKDRLNLWIHFIFEELNYASMSKITGPLIQMES